MRALSFGLGCRPFRLQLGCPRSADTGMQPKAAVTRKICHYSGNMFWYFGRKFYGHTQFFRLPKKFLNYEQRIGLHDWPLFGGEFQKFEDCHGNFTK